MKKNTMILAGIGMTLAASAHAALNVGVASADITPPKRVPLHGQFGLRMSQDVETPLTANVVALESAGEQAVFVSLDIVLVPPEFLGAVREKVAKLDAAINPGRIVVSATHTHTGPTLDLSMPKLPAANDIMDYPEAIDFTAERVTGAIVAAWKNRKPGKMAFGLDFAVLGENRRAVYADGSAKMYGGTAQADFRALEAKEDYDVGALFFLDEGGTMLAAAVNVACPSQVVELRSKINADFWHPAREALKKRFGAGLVVLGWCSAAGDVSPRPLYRKGAVNRMNALRKEDEMQAIARKIDRAVADTWDAVKGTATADVPLAHRAETLQLPMRKVTGKEYAEAKAECDKIAAKLKENPGKAPAEVDWMAGGWHGDVVTRYEAQQKDPDGKFAAPVHVIRIGEIAVFTNPFELFTGFGVQMKARSPAVQTFVVQLTGGKAIGAYLPTETAVRGGSYSAVIQSNPVGPEGGQMLVDETLKIAEGLFKR